MNTTLAALIVFGCRCGCVARKDSSSSPSGRSFDCRLQGHDQALHQLANDVLRSQSLLGDYCSTRNAFGANL
jgi:hypothetical protein